MIIESKKDFTEFIEQHTGSICIAGAGQYGEMLGEILNEKDIAWEGYVDKRGEGKLCGKSIIPYTDINISEWVYLISTPKFSRDMRIALEERGVKSERIFWFEDRQLIFDICGDSSNANKGEYSTFSYGEEDPDKTYMVMERRSLFEGPFCDMSLFLKGCAFADENGYIPIVDRLFFPSFLYQNLEHVRLDNAWEYYFEQPGGVPLKVVTSKKKNVRRYTLSDSANLKRIGNDLQYHSDMSKEEVEKWRMYVKKYIHLNAEMQREVDADYERIYSKNPDCRTLGVSLREGYQIEADLKIPNMIGYIQPKTEDVIQMISEVMEKFECDRIYLTCQFEETIHIFSQKFGDKVVYLSRKRASRKETIERIRNKNTGLLTYGDVETQSKEYIRDIYMLSKSDALMCGWSSGSSMAVFLGQCDLDHISFFDKEAYAL